MTVESLITDEIIARLTPDINAIIGRLDALTAVQLDINTQVRDMKTAIEQAIAECPCEPVAPPPVDPPPATDALDWTPDKSIAAGAYSVENNQWGASDRTGRQGVSIAALADGGVTATLQWQWSTGASEVAAYPAVLYGRKPGRMEGTAQDVLPARIASLSKLTSDYATTSTVTGKGQLAYDLWVVPTDQAVSGFNAAPKVAEIMVCLDPFGGYGLDRNPAWYQEDATIAGKIWKVYRAENFAGGWRFLVFQAPESRPAGTIDFIPFLTYLRGKGWLTGQEYITSVELGVEPTEGAGTTVISRFSVSAEVAGVVSPPTPADPPGSVRWRGALWTISQTGKILRDGAVIHETSLTSGVVAIWIGADGLLWQRNSAGAEYRWSSTEHWTLMPAAPTATITASGSISL